MTQSRLALRDKLKASAGRMLCMPGLKFKNVDPLSESCGQVVRIPRLLVDEKLFQVYFKHSPGAINFFFALTHNLSVFRY